MCTSLFKPPTINLPAIPTPPKSTPLAPIAKAQVSDGVSKAGLKDSLSRFRNTGSQATQMSDLLGLAVPQSSLGLMVPGGNT